MANPFDGFDLSTFWEDSDYARKNYVEEAASLRLLKEIEAELRFPLPASYVALMTTQNGGVPRNQCFPTKTTTSWAEDHVMITGIFAIGRKKQYSLCGDLGSPFMQKEWGYPDFGICICNCPSAGHDMIMLDYRKAGTGGEPQVIHVDQESDFEITVLAPDFETFIRGLVHESVYDTSNEDLQNDLRKVEEGSFSTHLSALIASARQPSFQPILRSICGKLTREKGHFALHGDELSQLVYDLLFDLHTGTNKTSDPEDYLKEVFPKLIVLGDQVFSTGGYAPGFVEEWMAERLRNRQIVRNRTGCLEFADVYRRQLMARIEPFK